MRIWVSDTGPGIPAENLERLFTPFERLGADQSGIEGTGLGLALSKRLVDAMGGEIGVKSVIGHGSTFWVDLPLTESQAERLVRERSGPLAAAMLPQQARNVLYIEDNLSNIRLVEDILEYRPEIRLIPSMQGGLGLQLAREHIPDLILLDVHLPDMTGTQVLSSLRADPATRSIPVVVISADATPKQIDRLLAQGASKYLTKPLDVKQFLKVLQETLKGQDN
jgi:CheY-like chemotaxis protein